MLKICFILVLNFVTISFDSSYVKNVTPMGLVLLFSLLFFYRFFVFFLAFYYSFFSHFLFVVSFLDFSCFSFSFFIFSEEKVSSFFFLHFFQTCFIAGISIRV